MAGLSRQTAWHTGSAFGDYDEDGDLDLFLAGYLDLNALPLEGPAPVCNYLGLDTFCGPLGLKAGADLLYRNNGDGAFTDVTKPSGLSASAARYGFSAVFEDLNQDGRVDLFVANDSAPNFLFLNPTVEAPVGTSTTTDGWTFWLFQFRDRLSCSKTAQPWTIRGSGCVYWTSRIIGGSSGFLVGE